jgi:hypothetical protein
MAWGIIIYRGNYTKTERVNAVKYLRTVKKKEQIY